MTYPVYIMARVPGASPDETVEWESICHSEKPFVSIHYESRRWVSRWRSHDRKRRFAVWWKDLTWSYHKTLAAARNAAAKLAQEQTK